MSFLAPFFLAGIALVAGPILFHLIRQAQRNRVVFSSTEFLEKSEPKRERSRRIQNPWLLLVRCLIIALLAFAFARPFIPSASLARSIDSIQRNVVIAIDNSASMWRTGYQEELLLEANKLIESLRPSDTLTLLSFDDETTRILDSDEWSTIPFAQRLDFAAHRLNEIQPSSRPGLIDKGIIAAVAAIDQQRERNENAAIADIYILSDFASGTSVDRLVGLEWPERTSFNRIQIGATDTQANLGLRWLGWGRNPDSSALARLAITTSRSDIDSALSLQTYDANTRSPIGPALQIRTEKQTEKLITLPLPNTAENTPIRFELSGDSDPFDNTLYAAPDYVPELRIAILSDHQSNNAKEAPYFLQKAFQGFESPHVTVNNDAGNTEQPDGYFIDRNLTSAEVDTIRAEIEEGKSAFLLVSETDALANIRALTKDESWQLEPSKNEYLLFGDIDFQHPLFKPFTDSRFSNFASIRTWDAFTLEFSESRSTQVLARFDDGSPLLCEVKIGIGSLFVWASSWRPSSSQWILSTKFIPFLHRFALLCSGGPPLESNALWNAENAKAYQELPGLPNVSGPGLFPVSGTTGNDRWIAMQLSPRESLTTPISSDRWDQLQLPELTPVARLSLLERIADTSKQESNREIEQRQHIWQWMLWAALALLCLESIVAIRSTPKREAVS